MFDFVIGAILGGIFFGVGVTMTLAGILKQRQR